MEHRMQHTTLCVASEDTGVHRTSSLVCAAKSGSAAAFAELRSLYSDRIYRTILGIVKNPEDAEDALQDSFLRAYMALRGFEGRANFYTWLTRIAINSSLMILRKRRSHLEVSIHCSSETDGEAIPFDFRDTMPDPEESYDRRQRHLKLLRAIRKLTPNLREVVEFRMIRECTLMETANELDITEAAVKSRLYRARRRLASSSAISMLARNRMPLA
jgi:RNA polymerase sigma-70 factor, ECF subfamily